MEQSLRDIRKRRGLTLKEVAERAGITEGQASRIERNGTGSLSTALRLSEILKAPVEAFAPRDRDAA